MVWGGHPVGQSAKHTTNKKPREKELTGREGKGGDYSYIPIELSPHQRKEIVGGGPRCQKGDSSSLKIPLIHKSGEREHPAFGLNLGKRSSR